MNAKSPAAPIKMPASLGVLRWTARVWSLLSLGVVLMFALGERMNLARFTPGELLMFLCFPLGVMLGMALAWRWELWGGGLAVASLVAFYGLDWWRSHRFPGGWFFIILCSPGFVFLLCGYWGQAVKRHSSKE